MTVLNKIIAVFLLIVTLFASTHTTLAFHYCGGSLHSVGIGAEHKKCCCDDERRHCGGEQRLCGDDAKIQTKSCCSDLFLDIETDDFTKSRLVAENVQDFQPAMLLFGISIMEVSHRFSANSFQIVFPPGNGAKSGIDLLLAICILRI